MKVVHLIWENTGPFKRTIVYKEEIDHNFPMPHKDVLEQFVNYEVPADKFDASKSNVGDADDTIMDMAKVKELKQEQKQN